MKTFKLYNEKLLIHRAIQNDREAQQQLFAKHSPKMLGICRQYVKDIHYAEDLLLSGFLKVFTKLSTFKHEGSFEGWIRRIMVNTCISHLRKKNLLNLSDEDFVFNEAATESLENTSVTDIQKLIDALPEGYKIVFNLFAIEGFKHSEIASNLGISLSTSKTQLFRARKLLQKNYIKMNTLEHGNK